MHHHVAPYIAATEADRRARVSERRPPADAGELEAMLVAAARGDHVSWTTLVERFTTRVRAVAVRYRLSEHDVDDVLQTTWLRLLEHIEDLRDPTAVGAWLETTARHESLRVIRGAKRELPTDTDLGGDRAEAPVDERALVEAERRAALLAGIGRLPPSQRRVVGALLAHPAMSYEAIARSISCPIGSIGPTRARSLAGLRRDLELARAIGATA
jgi:RNA polymerase sigma factor (sigma-70 family)